MWRSSSARTRLRASSFCPSAGSSRGHSPGSIVAEGWPRIGNVSIERRSPSSASPPSASCYENSAIQDNVPGQTLRKLSPWELLRYGSSKSEEDLSIAGANSGLEYSNRALSLLEEHLGGPSPSTDILESAFHCRSNISGLYFWMWMLESKDEHLGKAIETLVQALADADRVLQNVRVFPVGRYAQGHL